MSQETAGSRAERWAFGAAVAVALGATFGAGAWIWGLAESPAPGVARPVAVRTTVVRPPAVVERGGAAPKRAPAIIAADPRVAEPRSDGPVMPAEPAPAAVGPAPPEPRSFVLAEPASATPAITLLPSAPWFAVAGATDAGSAHPTDAAKVCATDRSLGTALRWACSPAEAAEQARNAGKLVFLIHVSGNFEDPGFT